MERALIVETDDLGLSRSFNAGIRVAVARGVVTSTCVLVNGAAFDEAVEEVVPDFPALGLGVHLNIVEGSTTRPAVPRGSPLVDAGGGYRMGFPALLLGQRNRTLLAEIGAPAAWAGARMTGWWGSPTPAAWTAPGCYAVSAPSRRTHAWWKRSPIPACSAGTLRSASRVPPRAPTPCFPGARPSSRHWWIRRFGKP